MKERYVVERLADRTIFRNNTSECYTGIVIYLLIVSGRWLEIIFDDPLELVSQTIAASYCDRFQKRHCYQYEDLIN